MLSSRSRKRLHGQSQMPHLVVLTNKSSMLSITVLCCSIYFSSFFVFEISMYKFDINFGHRYLVSQACIKPLCDLLVCPDPRIVTVCLEGLENILKVGESEKLLGRSGDANLYAQMIEDADGLEKIENLQSHDNTEIYEKAVKLLETYWLEEDEEPLPPGGAPSHPGFQFGGSELTVPAGGFSFN